MVGVDADVAWLDAAGPDEPHPDCNPAPSNTHTSAVALPTAAHRLISGTNVRAISQPPTRVRVGRVIWRPLRRAPTIRLRAELGPNAGRGPSRTGPAYRCQLARNIDDVDIVNVEQAG